MNNEEITQIIGELDLYRLQKNLDRAGFGPIPVAIGDLSVDAILFSRNVFLLPGVFITFT